MILFFLFQQPDAQSIVTLKEGSESEQFWEVLGGRKVHPSHREPKESAKDPHLFSCSIIKGLNLVNFDSIFLLR